MINLILFSFFLSLTPVGELRAGLPFAVFNGLPVWFSYFICVFANALVFPFLFFFLEFIHKKFMHFNGYRSAFDRYMEKVRKKSHAKIEKYGYFGLFLLVAIPLPFTGAYTGTLASWFFGMNRFKSFIAVSLGVAVAGLVVLLILFSGIKIFNGLF
jgi:uncharacterized membrane protein